MTPEDAFRRVLHDKIDRLSEHEAAVVERFVDAVLRPVHSEALPPTWLASQGWREAFATWLQGYHALSDDPLGRLQFEAAFNHACEADGWRVNPAKTATQRFYDTTIYGSNGTEKRISLKASSAGDMSISSVHISKLTEGAWIQDARRQLDRRDYLVQLFHDYKETTASIFILRGFRGRDGFAVLYELVEIPTTIFDRVLELTTRQAQEPTISLPPGASARDREFAIRLDRSDSKITLTGIRIDLCTVHGRWGVGMQPGLRPDIAHKD